MITFQLDRLMNPSRMVTTPKFRMKLYLTGKLPNSSDDKIIFSGLDSISFSDVSDVTDLTSMLIDDEADFSDSFVSASERYIAEIIRLLPPNSSVGLTRLAFLELMMRPICLQE